MNQASSDDDLVAELLPAFLQEADEQLAGFEQLLLQLEDAPDDHDLLDALFRCAHTVKGSAGLFGLDRVVAFTHHVESLLDRLREGQLALTPALSTLLLQCNDMIRTLVAGAHLPEDDPATCQRRDGLVQQLHHVGGQAGGQAARPVDAAAGAAPAAVAAGAGPGLQRWRLTARFQTDTFRHGMDPLAVLSYLAELGELESCRCDAAAVPRLEQLDPQDCHLAMCLVLRGRFDREVIEHAFEFVREDCDLLIEALPVEADSPAADATADAVAPPVAAPAGPAGASRAPAAPRSRETAPDDGGFIRVHATRLDEVINLLGELVIAGAGAAQLAQQTRQRSLIESHQRITRLIEGIRNSTLKLRMVPIGDTFARFRRVVRDTAAELGKDVALEIVGGDTELDKAVVERIADPLMHLVRNALDHGLETPAQRQAAGKPAQGRLTLSACHEAGSVLIRIVDDGRGIQRDKVLQRAWQRGLLPEGVVPPEDEVLRLIFEPGFSTAETVTNLSGRGVGMDVVRSNIEALRGSIHIASAPGAGSTMEIRLPLTLAIIDGFLVGVGASRFIFPLDSVVEVIASRRGELAVDAQGRGCVELRGRLLPVIDLRRLYTLEGSTQERHSIVVVRAGSRQLGVLVDSLLGQHQTVIKPLGRLLRSLKGIAGSSILGSGEVALIVDADELGQIAAAPRHATTPPAAPELNHPQTRIPTAASGNPPLPVHDSTREATRDPTFQGEA